MLNVQRPISGDVTRFVSGRSLDEYYRERAEPALAAATSVLGAAGIPHEDLRRIGDPGPTIAAAAVEKGCDLIMMGARGLGSHTAALLGSVAQSTIEHATMPVMVVK